MTGILESEQLRGGVVRWLVWGGAAALLLLPLVAMQFTEEVQWTWHDFVIMGVMLGEPLSLRAIIGGVVVLVGVWLTSRQPAVSRSQAEA